MVAMSSGPMPSLAVLDVIEDESLVANAAHTGAYLRQGVAALAERHAVIGDVRGQGFLLGVELADEARAPAAGHARKVTEALHERGVLLSATGPASKRAQDPIAAPLPARTCRPSSTSTGRGSGRLRATADRAGAAYLTAADVALKACALGLITCQRARSCRPETT
jgi:aminotransferase class III